MRTSFSNPNREIEYRLAKWIVANLEARGRLSPKEIKTIWERLLAEYKPPTASVEVPCDSIRRREFERFITTLESLPDQVTDFDETLWGSLAVYAKGDLRFMLACEMEITA